MMKENSESIDKLNQQKNILMKELIEIKEKYKEKGDDLYFLSEQYNKLKNEYEIMKKKNEEKEEVNEEYITQLVNKEIENIKKERMDYLNKVNINENFTFEIKGKEQKNINTNMNYKEHKLLSDNVDEILHNIQQKKEKLLLTQKMINHIEV